MWQVFEGWDYDDSGIRHAGMFKTRDEAEARADDIWADTRFKAWAVAVNFDTMQATLFGGHQPFGGEWVEEKEIDEPEFLGPRQKPLSALSFFDINKPLRDFGKSLAENANAENQLLSRLKGK